MAFELYQKGKTVKEIKAAVAKQFKRQVITMKKLTAAAMIVDLL